MTTVTLYIHPSDMFNFFIINKKDLYTYTNDERKELLTTHRFRLYYRAKSNYIQINVPIDMYMIYKNFGLVL